MICKKCGFKAESSEEKCPVCGADLEENVSEYWVSENDEREHYKKKKNVPIKKLLILILICALILAIGVYIILKASGIIGNNSVEIGQVSTVCKNSIL